MHPPPARERTSTQENCLFFQNNLIWPLTLAGFWRTIWNSPHRFHCTTFCKTSQSEKKPAALTLVIKKKLLKEISQQMTKPCWQKHSQKRKKVKQFLKEKKYFVRWRLPPFDQSTSLHSVALLRGRRVQWPAHQQGPQKGKGVARVLFGSVFVYMCLCICICIYVCICICVIRGLTAHWGKEVASLARGGQCSFFYHCNVFLTHLYFYWCLKKLHNIVQTMNIRIGHP